jgi:hypothetical protein
MLVAPRPRSGDRVPLRPGFSDRQPTPDRQVLRCSLSSRRQLESSSLMTSPPVTKLGHAALRDVLAACHNNLRSRRSA